MAWSRMRSGPDTRVAYSLVSTLAARSPKPQAAEKGIRRT
jgi:hypothetical protein